MAEEDPNLYTSLQKLELDTSKPLHKNDQPTPSNPFIRRRRSKSLSSIIFRCKDDHCHHVKKTTSFKRSGTKKILREPILKLIGKSGTRSKTENREETDTNVFGGCCAGHERDFRSIVTSCQQLSLANANDGVERYSLPSFNQMRSDKKDAAGEKGNSVSTTCAHQARMSGAPPCDVTIDELASYFETFVHIPKKMSSMAEMMYI